ncbi:hypothetical protein LEP1GSC133_2577 [Leptospira borgpetersenii serovar Pomona str. 200901868]|uniref:Uncharacterized protein n=1 Tax=Leptospira borgpetersenii serovar Pomona str. 200901868 TaxID=1192866 RepID=M6VUB0_LEPBO|nr:hypothetical protein LEP1GSC133_2577 [Leptospira borgpetersenii serovar Pomona str. 200901868]
MTGKLNSIYERNQEELLPDFEFYRNRNCRVCISFSDGKRIKTYNKRKDLFFREMTGKLIFLRMGLILFL